MPVSLITGSAGFVGRHFAAGLAARGWDVVGVDIVTGNDALECFRQETKRFDLVVHAAASSPHREAIDTQPVHMARNLQLDAAMFDWAVRTKQRRVLYLSSSSAYPARFQTREWLEAHGERMLFEDLINLTQWGKTGDWSPDATYGWVKLTGEMLAQQARMAGLPVTVVRTFSGYGEDQSENFPFRAIVERARRRDDPFVIWGDGTQVRDWVHIDDVFNGAMEIIESGTTDPVNICTGFGTDMTGLALIAMAEVGYGAELEYRLDKPAGVRFRVGDPTRFHQYYQPKIDIVEGVRRALRG